MSENVADDLDVLGARNRHFAMMIVQGIPPARAYIESGLLPKNAPCGSYALIKATELLVEPYMEALITSYREVDPVMDMEYVVKELKANHHLARLEGNIPASNKALELIGVEKGGFRRRVALSGDEDGPEIKIGIKDLDKLLALGSR